MPTRRTAVIADRETRPAQMEMMVRSLQAEHREILIATYFSHRSTREAALSLGIAPVVAKERLYEAMCELNLMLATWRPKSTPAHLRGPTDRTKHRL